MNIEFNKIKSFSNKKLKNFLLNYYQETFAEGYNKAIENMIQTLNTTPGIGIKTYDKIWSRYRQIAKEEMKGFIVEEVEERI